MSSSPRPSGNGDERPLTLSARDVRRDYRLGGEIVHAVRGVSLDVGEGEYVAIVGPSGCGKSTMLNLLGAIDQPDAGSVMMVAPVAASRLPVGSSAKRIWGRMLKARASATRCCSPPESWAG